MRCAEPIGSAHEVIDQVGRDEVGNQCKFVRCFFVVSLLDLRKRLNRARGRGF